MSSIVEVNLGHFSTSLPNLRPILDCLTGRTVNSITYASRRSHLPERYQNLDGSRSERSSRSEVTGVEDTDTLVLEERGRGTIVESALAKS